MTEKIWQPLYNSKYWNCYILIKLHDLDFQTIFIRIFTCLNFCILKWNSRKELKQIAMNHLVYDCEIAVFKLKGYTLAVVLKPNLTKLIKELINLTQEIWDKRWVWNLYDTVDRTCLNITSLTNWNKLAPSLSIINLTLPFCMVYAWNEM